MPPEPQPHAFVHAVQSRLFPRGYEGQAPSFLDVAQTFSGFNAIFRAQWLPEKVFGTGLTQQPAASLSEPRQGGHDPRRNSVSFAMPR